MFSSWSSLLLTVLAVSYTIPGVYGDYKIGVGIGDVTGPAAEINMMGYANSKQKSYGVHTRQFSRAFIVDDGQKRVVFASIDTAMISDIITMKVVEKLTTKYGGTYNESNICLSAIHTHSGPGGYHQYVLYLVTSSGFVKQSFNAIVDGIVASIEMAHDNIQPGRIFVNQGELKGANINRSPASYLRNPKSERDKYKANTDTLMTIVKFTTPKLKPIGLISWYPVHCTSMNNTNGFISSDNKGYASMKFEQDMNGKDVAIGKGPFVAAFAQANEGDVSPNTNGPRCQDSGLRCDFNTSTCHGKNELCVASGPGKNMFESTRIIGTKQYQKAKDLFNAAKLREVNGPVDFVHQFVNMANTTVTLGSKGTTARTCLSAMGYSFAAGTTDGPGAFNFKQGSTNGTKLWNLISHFISKPTQEDIACHAPKPILLNTGRIKYPYAWQQEITPSQILRIGDLFLLAVPGEFTTMSGRRLKNAIQQIAIGAGVKTPIVQVAGLSNAYANYITTFEEYHEQRYEGASTAYGPHELEAYIQTFQRLAHAMFSKRPVARGPSPPNLLSKQWSFVIGVLYDNPGLNKKFGQVIQDVQKQYRQGSEVVARFVSANPRNDLMTGKTFLTVERQNARTKVWEILFTDTNWETRFKWTRTSTLLAESEAEILWKIPSDQPVGGPYRIRHFGNHKNILGKIAPFSGSSSTFSIISSTTASRSPSSFFNAASISSGVNVPLLYSLSTF